MSAAARNLAAQIGRLVERIEEAERRLANFMRPGKVTEVDYGKGLVKVKVGDLDSQWVPWIEKAGPSHREWNAPEVGEQVHLVSPSGEPGQGWVMRGGYSDAAGQPHDIGGEKKIVAAKIILVGEVVVHGDVHQSNGEITSNGHRIDDTHKHTEVMPGGALSGPPQ